jgi:8-oxo-dGTP pyrophosphatase MutT (NUDIX family)
MSKKQKPPSCGILIKYQNKYLICRATKTEDAEGRDIWSIPKGRSDDGEKITETAIREVLEETGLDFSDRIDELQFICAYTHNSRQYWFYALEVDEIDLDSMFCTTMVDEKRPYPEVDKYILVDKDEYLDYVHNHMAKVIHQLR